MKQTLLNLYFQFFWILAKIYLYRHKPLVIWVTWSIWKTSCRMVISEVLKLNLKDKVVYTSDKNFNWELGLSFSILWISNYTPSFLWVVNIFMETLYISLFWKKKYDIIFLEYWIDHIWEMDFLLNIVKPDYSIVTKIDKVHSKQFKTRDNIASEKYKLLINSKSWVYLNLDDEYSQNFEDKINVKKTYFSTNLNLNSQKLNLAWINQNLILKNELAYSNFDLQKDKKTIFNVTTNISWEENVGYVCVWYDILDEIYKKYYNNSFFDENINSKMDLELTLQPSRFSIFKWINNSILIDSTYNAAPWSMKVVINNVLNLQKSLYKDFELVLVLWEMRELWDYSESEHKTLANIVNPLTKNIFILWEDMKKYFSKELEVLGNNNYKFFKNSYELWLSLKDFVSNSDKKYLILFKWSQNTIFLEEAVKLLQFSISDNLKVCRQQDFWLENKGKFFWQNLKNR